AWCVGSGGGEGAAEMLATTLAEVAADSLTAVVDADALAHLPEALDGSPNDSLRGRLVLTPHAGELARMLDVGREEVEAAPLRHARAAGERWGSTVLLKGRQ